MNHLLADEAATQGLGARLAAHLPAGVVLYLDGDLGAGKTTLARALIQHLVPGARVKSPTYSLVETYDIPHGVLHHLDLYRIADPGEFDYLGLDDAGATWLIEWPERGGDRIPPADLILRLRHDGDGRVARLEAVTARAQAWLAAAFPTL
jgi:tRNA threonylcarbamoyladenosine biosynthesis protein TsaE